ncbi:MAG: hypothetical protein ABMA02_18530 [Saprospiraceae bacterium]
MKALISISLPLAALVATSTWSTKPTSSNPAEMSRPVPVELPAPKKGAKIWASAATLYKNETFDLRFAAPNAPFLGVVDPSGHFFYLVFPTEASEGQLKPLVDSRSFLPMKALTIHTGSLKADPYMYGVYENQRVFTQSGTYTFILGSNLHVDDPTLVEKVAIKYVHKQRPVSTTAEAATTIFVKNWNS